MVSLDSTSHAPDTQRGAVWRGAAAWAEPQAGNVPQCSRTTWRQLQFKLDLKQSTGALDVASRAHLLLMWRRRTALKTSVAHRLPCEQNRNEAIEALSELSGSRKSHLAGSDLFQIQLYVLS